MPKFMMYNYKAKLPAVILPFKKQQSIQHKCCPVSIMDVGKSPQGKAHTQTAEDDGVPGTTKSCLTARWDLDHLRPESVVTNHRSGY